MEMRKGVPGSLLFCLSVSPEALSLPTMKRNEGLPLEPHFKSYTPLPRESCLVSRVTLVWVLVSGLTLGVGSVARYVFIVFVAAQIQTQCPQDPSLGSTKINRPECFPCQWSV